MILGLYQRSKAKRSIGMMLLRNCLIILLTNKEKLPVGNVAEYLKVTPIVVKNILRKQDEFHVDGAPYRNFVKKSYGD